MTHEISQTPASQTMQANNNSTSASQMMQANDYVLPAIFGNNENNNASLTQRERLRQESVLRVRDEYLPEDLRSTAVPDLFAKYPPAEESDIVHVIAALTAAFPKMESAFWGLLTSMFYSEGFSKERLNYILKTAVTSPDIAAAYRYGSLTVAHFTSITNQMTLYDYSEAVRMTQKMHEEGNPEAYGGGFVYVQLNPRISHGWQITTLKEGLESGLRIMPFIYS